MSDVKVERILHADEHVNQKWYVLQGSVDGISAVTKRVSIAVSAIVSDPTIVERARANLISDVSEYHANYLALQKL